MIHGDVVFKGTHRKPLAESLADSQNFNVLVWEYSRECGLRGSFRTSKESRGLRRQETASFASRGRAFGPAEGSRLGNPRPAPRVVRTDRRLDLGMNCPRDSYFSGR